MRDESYTISEYNEKTKKYTKVGDVWASSREEAKERFIEETKWKERKGIVLFVRNPIYR